MKKRFSFFLLVVIFVLSLFTLTGCKQKKWIFFELRQYGDTSKIEYDSETRTTTLIFYINPMKGYDVDDFKEVKITYQVIDGNKYSKRTTKNVYVPEGARGNPDLQYFYVVLEGEKIDPAECQLFVNYAKGVLKGDETMVDDDTTPSIGQTLLIGVITLVVALIASCLGLSTRDDPKGLFLIGFANIVPVIMNIYMYIKWGILRGLVFSVFCIAIIVITVIASNYIDY